jgi:type II secretory pathway pseudopilin PulG
VFKWLSKQDAKGLAALITAVVAILGLLGGAIKFLVGLRREKTKQKKAARRRRTAALSALRTAGDEVLSDLEHGGDMGTASEAGEKLSQPVAEANKLGIAEVTAIGERISATARQGDRGGLAQGLVDLDALRKTLMR